MRGRGRVIGVGDAGPQKKKAGGVINQRCRKVKGGVDPEPLGHGKEKGNAGLPRPGSRSNSSRKDAAAVVSEGGHAKRNLGKSSGWGKMGGEAIERGAKPSRRGGKAEIGV